MNFKKLIAISGLLLRYLLLVRFYTSLEKPRVLYFLKMLVIFILEGSSMSPWDKIRYYFNIMMYFLYFCLSKNLGLGSLPLRILVCRISFSFVENCSPLSHSLQCGNERADSNGGHLHRRPKTCAMDSRIEVHRR